MWGLEGPAAFFWVPLRLHHEVEGIGSIRVVL